MISPLDFGFLFLLLPLASTSSCPTRCGNVSIPYPFGVGSGCSLEASFSIICNASTTPPKPYLNISNEAVEVVKIRVANPPYIRIKHPQLRIETCNDTSPGVVRMMDIDLSETQYTLSSENWLTTIGCDDLAAVTTYKSQSDYEGLNDACIGFCSAGSNSTHRGFCPNNVDGNSMGEGCCRIPIPKGSMYLYAGLRDMSKTLNRTRLFPCSYAFVMEKGIMNEPRYSYNFSVLLHNSTTSLKNDRPPEVRLDWRIGSHNCSKAPQNSGFACRENSDCVDFGANIGRYLFNCSQGYKGNPYIYQGCKGYTGDGKLKGNGCTRLPPSNIIKIILIGLGSALALLLFFSICFVMHKLLEKRKNRKRKEYLFKQLLLLQQTSEDTFGKTKLFTAKELEKATDHFNESRICGQGGQGIVYKGMLSDGTIVAIKKLKQVDENQVDQFINEVVILSQINHKNVVKLLGCCLAREAPLVVYEFVPNGTLFDLIRDPNIEIPLKWSMRIKIAAEVAGAVAYLHSASSIPIYHRDIKSTNILLDDKYIAKVSDFGISRFVEVDQTHLTTLVKGTFGYVDPEYFQTSQYTEKSDVYSFGVVLVELLTGQRPISLERSEVQRNLATHFLTSMETNNLDAILDAHVSEEGSKEDVLAVARLAKRCLNVTGKMRPTMKEVVMELETLRISKMSSIVNDGPEEEFVFETKPAMFSDIEYTCTTSDHSVATSSSNACP